MGLLDRLLGRAHRSTRVLAPPPAPGYGERGHGEQGYDQQEHGGRDHSGQHRSGPGGPRTEDERALERYRYLLRTAPPEQIEQAHAEAFAALTPEQRRQVLADLSAEVPEHDRARSDDPASLARMATRAEVRQPGTLERSFSRGGMGGVGGMGMGGLIGGSLLASVAGAFVGTAIADAMFDASDSGGEGYDEAGAEGDPGADDGGGGDELASGGYGEDPGGGAGGDVGGGDFGGDFGGGDF